jgi:hypothetical protein
MCWDTLQH